MFFYACSDADPALFIDPQMTRIAELGKNHLYFIGFVPILHIYFDGSFADIQSHFGCCCEGRISYLDGNRHFQHILTNGLVFFIKVICKPTV